MRLIDADKMKLEVNNENPIVVYYSKEIEEWRDSQPTVKAIPIEWLQKKYDKWKDRDMLGWSYCIKLLIEDWEKENETNAKR